MVLYCVLNIQGNLNESSNVNLLLTRGCRYEHERTQLPMYNLTNTLKNMFNNQVLAKNKYCIHRIHKNRDSDQC